MIDQDSFQNFSTLNLINTFESYGDIFLEILMTILAKPSLREVYFDLLYTRSTSNPLPWLEQCSIKHLAFENNCTVNFFRNTLICLPELETFKVDNLDFDEEIDLNHHENDDNDSDTSDIEPVLHVEPDGNQIERKERFASIESTNNLKFLILDSFRINMSRIEWLIKEIPTLKKLRLITTSVCDDELILDGYRWENLLLNIDKFEFIFLVNLSIDSTFDLDNCIIKFQTPFWIKEKKWFITLEKYDNEITLYTLPYYNNSFDDQNQSNSYDYRSTANNILQNQSMNKVHDLYIDVSHMKKGQIDVKYLNNFFFLSYFKYFSLESSCSSFFSN